MTFRRLLVVAAIAVVTGILLSVAYQKWTGVPILTRALQTEAPAGAEESEGAAAEQAPEASEADAENASATDEERDVSGEWTLTSHVTEATHKEFEALELAYRVELKVDGGRVTGEGHKIAENGKPLSGRQRTPIALDGEREGDRLMLKFTERGARRTSGGTFFLRIEDEVLTGTFASGAAGSTGRVTAQRQAVSRSDEQQKSRAR